MIAAIGHLPETLADRCIVIRMQRKRGGEVCERLRNLDAPASSASVLQNSKTPTLQHSQTPELSTAAAIRKLCARFALEHQHSITTATPQTPPGLNDRACDIWEPLLVIADIAGGHWPEKARAAAVAFTSGAQENSPSSTLLFDIGLIFILLEKERLFTSQIVSGLNCNRFAGRPWMEARKGKPVTEIWLSQQLRPFGVRPKNLRIGAHQGKGYELPDLQETFSRYVPSSEIDNFKAGLRSPVQPSAGAAESPEAG